MAGSVEIHCVRSRGGARGTWGRPLSWDQTEAQRAEKFFWRPTRNSNLLFFPSSHERHVLACQIPPPLPPLKPAKQDSLLKRLNKFFHYHYFIFYYYYFYFYCHLYWTNHRKISQGMFYSLCKGSFIMILRRHFHSEKNILNTFYCYWCAPNLVKVKNYHPHAIQGIF